MSRKATELALRAAGRGPLQEAGAAVREALFGDLAAARQSAMAALGFSKSRDVKYGAAIAFALSGDLSRAEALTNDLKSAFQKTLAFNSAICQPCGQSSPSNRESLRTWPSFCKKPFPISLALLQVSSSDHSGLSIPSISEARPIWPHTGEPEKTAAEFQKIVDHRGIVLSDPIGA